MLTYRHRQTKIGGWVEFQDFHLVNYSEDGSLKEGNNVNRFYELLCEACDRINRPVTIGVNLKQWAEEAGFKNVEHKVFRLPLGTWPQDPKMVSDLICSSLTTKALSLSLVPSRLTLRI